MATKPNHSNLKVEQTTTGVVVHVVGCQQLNEQTTPPIQEQLVRLLGHLGTSQLQLNLEGIRFLSSTALGMLLLLHKKLRATGGHLLISNVNEVIYEVFEATLLTRVLDVHRHNPPDSNREA